MKPLAAVCGPDLQVPLAHVDELRASVGRRFPGTRIKQAVDPPPLGTEQPESFLKLKIVVRRCQPPAQRHSHPTGSRRLSRSRSGWWRTACQMESSSCTWALRQLGSIWMQQLGMLRWLTRSAPPP